MRPFGFGSNFRRKAFCLVLAFMFVVPTGLLARPLPPQASPQDSKQRPLPPAQYIPSRNYDTRNITLNLRFDWDKEQAIGTATISFAPLSNDVRTVEFDAGNMTFNS